MNNLLNFIKETEEIKRLKELNKIFIKNKLLYDKIELMKEAQKKYVIARAKNDLILADKLKRNYQESLAQIIDLPFVEEYFELLNIFYQLLNNIKDELEKSLVSDF